jgi:transcription termination factor NusB
MVSDAMLYYNEGKPIKTIVVYSADIEETITTLDADSIKYKVDAFHMYKLDGDQTYENIKTKIDTGKQLTKQDLMSIVFLTLMKNSVEKVTRIEQSVELSKKLSNHDEQVQIQAMLGLLAEKFIKDPDELKRLKQSGVMSIG